MKVAARVGKGYSPPPMRESVYQSRLRKEYESDGAVVLKMDPRASTIPKGFPDLLVLLPRGGTRFIELKAKDGKVEPAQRYWHDRLRQMGHEVLVVKAKE